MDSDGLKLTQKGTNGLNEPKCDQMEQVGPNWHTFDHVWSNRTNMSIWVIKDQLRSNGSRWAKMGLNGFKIGLNGTNGFKWSIGLKWLIGPK